MAVSSIKPRLTIWAPLGAFTQKRTVPVVEIEPLNVVPVGSVIGSCVDDEESVKVETVVANTECAIKGMISTANNTVNITNLIFFIFPLEECLGKLRQFLLTVTLKKIKKIC